MPLDGPRTRGQKPIGCSTIVFAQLNKVIGENDAMDAGTLPAVKMPNRDNVIIRFPDRI